LAKLYQTLKKPQQECSYTLQPILTQIFLSAISVVRFCLFSEQRIRRCTKFDLMINTKLTFLVKPSFQKMAINNIWLDVKNVVTREQVSLKNEFHSERMTGINAHKQTHIQHREQGQILQCNNMYITAKTYTLMSQPTRFVFL